MRSDREIAIPNLQYVFAETFTLRKRTFLYNFLFYIKVFFCITFPYLQIVCFYHHVSTGLSLLFVKTSSKGIAESFSSLQSTIENEFERKENGWSCKNLGGYCIQL